MAGWLFDDRKKYRKKERTTRVSSQGNDDAYDTGKRNRPRQEQVSLEEEEKKRDPLFRMLSPRLIKTLPGVMTS